jgi:hypothetical protein
MKERFSMRIFLKAAAAGALTLGLLSGIHSAQAGAITVFSAQDDGAPAAGPFPNSSAAQLSFLYSAFTYEPVATLTFETLPVGAGVGGTPVSFLGGSFTLNTPYAAPYGGVNSGGTSSVYGFNTTPGGSNWLGFADGSATFTFVEPTHSFGFYTTGVQTIFTSALTLTFNDGANQSESLPINVNGGASYFGITDSSGFSSVTITDISDDAWGIDDVSFNSQVSPVPLPGGLAMFGAGLIGLGALGLRKARRRAA